ncbi:hypothetical protein BDV35DRAFT_353154 [Aspergillus flavus]|uniref:Mid2 domain-containing protein n=1 Tax=Aspergillus flavus TaxID=5059 RepID=A0A5N6GXV5_ASPFL|nr:hypothetical protein BDV35DRAFT_353154 [Aspergillus flavus]
MLFGGRSPVWTMKRTAAQPGMILLHVVPPTHIAREERVQPSAGSRTLEVSQSNVQTTVNTGNRDTDGYVGCVMSDYASVDWLSTLTVMRSGTGMSIIHYFTIYRGNKSYSSLAFATKRRLVSSTPTSSATLSSFTSVSTTSSISTTHTAEPTPSNSSSPSTPSSSTNTGAIAGGVVGGVAGAAILAALVWFLARRSKAEKVKSPTSAQDAWDMRTARDSSKFQQYPVQKLDAGLGPTPPPVYELPDATSNRQ